MRSYPWGMAEALSSSHSDVPALKRLLIELSFDDIKVPAPFLSMPQAGSVLKLIKPVLLLVLSALPRELEDLTGQN